MVMLREQVFQAAKRESASSVAYDTPSPKLLAFLKKHYGALPFRKYEQVWHIGLSPSCHAILIITAILRTLGQHAVCTPRSLWKHALGFHCMP